MKTLFLVSGAALLAASTAFAAEVQVVVPPGADDNVVVFETTYPIVPGPGFDAVYTDEQGILTQDIQGMASQSVVATELPAGFDPDVLINIWADETGALRYERVELTN